jgi:3,4-dihydroxy 2-butanone 4-phosphate synthase/GTP cyclohydrolase II
LLQEGRGIGLVNKLKAYELQDQGHDTVEANEKLGFRPDQREYGIGAQILRDIGVRRMRLMTNNPSKYIALSGYGLEIAERVPLEVEPTDSTRAYLRAKREKLGHLLKLV